MRYIMLAVLFMPLLLASPVLYAADKDSIDFHIVNARANKVTCFLTMENERVKQIPSRGQSGFQVIWQHRPKSLHEKRHKQGTLLCREMHSGEERTAVRLAFDADLEVSRDIWHLASYYVPIWSLQQPYDIKFVKKRIQGIEPTVSVSDEVRQFSDGSYHWQVDVILLPYNPRLWLD